MSTWLRLLPLELDSIEADSCMNPNHKLEPTDNKMGIMSQTSRQLYTLAMLVGKDAKQNMLDSEYCVDESRRNELRAKAAELGEKSSVLMQLMWISVRDELHMWGYSVGIRENFVVVRTPDTNDTPPFIKRLLGGE